MKSKVELSEQLMGLAIGAAEAMLFGGPGMRAALDRISGKLSSLAEELLTESADNGELPRPPVPAHDGEGDDPDDQIDLVRESQRLSDCYGSLLELESQNPSLGDINQEIIDVAANLLSAAIERGEATEEDVLGDCYDAVAGDLDDQEPGQPVCNTDQVEHMESLPFVDGSGDQNPQAPDVPATGTDAALLVWWTSQEDFNGKDVYDQTKPDDIPDYAWKELRSRYGRAGRGRLWVPDHIELSSLPVSEHDTRWTSKLEESGGIVIEAKHAAACEKWGGCITTITLDPVAFPKAPEVPATGTGSAPIRIKLPVMEGAGS